MQTRTDVLACFGKVPTHGDFLRYNTDSPTVQAFDAWLQKELYAMKTRDDGRLQSGYDEGPPYRFFYREATGDRLLVGVLQPSRDRVGRRYPLVIAREADRPASGDPEITRLPLADAAFFTSVVQLAGSAAAGEVDYRALESRLDDVADARTPSGAAAPAYEEYLRKTTFKTLVERIWGYFEDTRKYLVLKNLLDASEALERDGNGVLSSGLRLPLSSPLAADGHEVAFCLELSLRLTRLDRAPLSCFWGDGPGEDVPGALVLFPVSPPTAGFQALYAGPAGTAAWFDTQERGRDQALSALLSLPARYGELLEADDLTLHAFLDQL